MFMHHIGGWWMIGGGIVMLLFWGGIIALSIWGISRLVRHGGCCAITKESPVDIARGRYAKGEITKEQFEQIKKDLN